MGPLVPRHSQTGQGVAFCTETNQTGTPGLVLPAPLLDQSHPTFNCRPLLLEASKPKAPTAQLTAPRMESGLENPRAPAASHAQATTRRA